MGGIGCERRSVTEGAAGRVATVLPVSAGGERTGAVAGGVDGVALTADTGAAQELTTRTRPWSRSASAPDSPPPSAERAHQLNQPNPSGSATAGEQRSALQEQA